MTNYVIWFVCATEEVKLTDRIPKTIRVSPGSDRGDPSCRNCGDGLAGEGVESQQDTALGAYHYPQIETKERLRAQRVTLGTKLQLLRC